MRSSNAADSRLCLIKELLFTTKLCLSQVSSPRALLDCHLPRGRGCDIKQTQICQGRSLRNTYCNPTPRPSQASQQTSIPHGSMSVFVCTGTNSPIHTQPHSWFTCGPYTVCFWDILEEACLARSQTQNNANTGAASKTIQLGDLKVNRLTSDLTSPGFLMFY